MTPNEVLELTHKEFYLLMESHQEKVYDQLEMLSIEAIMMRRAYHEKKKLGTTDLFKRPKETVNKKVDKEDIREKIQHTQEYLSQFQNFNVGEIKGKGGSEDGNS